MNGLRRSISNVLAVAYKETALLRHDKTLPQNVLLQPIIMLLAAPSFIDQAKLSRRSLMNLGHRFLPAGRSQFLAPGPYRHCIQG